MSLCDLLKEMGSVMQQQSVLILFVNYRCCVLRTACAEADTQFKVTLAEDQNSSTVDSDSEEHIHDSDNMLINNRSI